LNFFEFDFWEKKKEPEKKTQTRPTKAYEEKKSKEFVDIEEIKQLPTVSNKATETNLADLFPGSEILTEDQ
jgi:hypothetical protein